MPASVCVFCASSDRCDETFLQSAYDLGSALAKRDIRLVYGGGGRGLMGQAANGVLDAGGRVTGIIPGFMVDREWAHPKVSDMRHVGTMHERKETMAAESDAFIALPGGCGTFEELLEVITWKRLELHQKPIIIVNLWDFYVPFSQLWERSVYERFMTESSPNLFTMVDSIDEAMVQLGRQL